MLGNVPKVAMMLLEAASGLERVVQQTLVSNTNGMKAPLNGSQLFSPHFGSNLQILNTYLW